MAAWRAPTRSPAREDASLRAFAAVDDTVTVASRFVSTDIVIVGVILIGVIGRGIDILMRLAERRLAPWKGRG